MISYLKKKNQNKFKCSKMQQYRRIEKFGEARQLNKLQEECGELVTAISKFRENPTRGNYNNVIEESVDVDIVLSQLKNYSFPKGDVNIWEKRKLYRLRGMGEDV